MPSQFSTSEQYPPIARTETVQDTYFGVTTHDPYRWMEEPESAEFDEWLAGQAGYARRVLAGIAGRDAWLARIRALGQRMPGRSGFAFAGGRVFCLRRDPALAVPVLVARDGDSAERVLLNPNEVTGPAHKHLDWFVPSPDGAYVACGISTGGSERCTVWIVDVASGAALDDMVGAGMVGFPFLSWLADCRSFVYHRYQPPVAGAAPEEHRWDSRTCLHRLGDDPAQDAVVLGRGLNPRVPLMARDRPFVYRAPGSDVVVAIVSHAALRGDRLDHELSACTIYAAHSAELTAPRACRWVRIAEPADLVSAFSVGQDIIYVVSHRDAPRGRVLAVPLADPSKKRVLLPEGDRVIDAMRIAGNWLLIREHDGGVARLRRIPLTGGEPREIPLPFDGDILEWANTERPAEVLLRMETWAVPPRVYLCDGDSGNLAGTDRGALTPAGFDDIVAYRTHATARDGTRVPMTLVHRNGLARTGAHSTLLTAYGSHGVTSRPEFAPGMLAWWERGGILAVAHIRGGGEYGRDWHEAGRLHAKETTINDFVDCAEQLMAQGYTTPAKLAGVGGSAGAIPVSGAMVRRPDLFTAIVLHVPVTNTLRIEFTPNGPTNVPEFGSTSTADGVRSALITDSYQRVHDGTEYPAVLITTGRNDPRVAPWQPAKMAARLQAATASDRPVLLRVEEQGGHGYGATADQRDTLLADELAFVLDQLG